MAKDISSAEFKALKTKVDHMEKIMNSLGLPTSPWLSPEKAGNLIGVSRKKVREEIEKAEYARINGLKYDLIWGVHYRKNDSNWQINPSEFEAVVFQPPELRPYIDLSN
jgi:hypothetical protein